MKKIIIIVLVAVLIWLICSTLAYVFLDSDSRKLDKSFEALRSGNLEQGLELCSNIKLNQYSDVCYITYIGMKINNKEPFEKEICNKISEKRKTEKEKLGCYV